VAKTTVGRRKIEYPRTISFGAGRVRISKRSNGAFALCWRELGQTRKTTKSSESKALEWAEQKAIDLDAGDIRQWVDRGEAEALEVLRGVAGSEDGALRRLVEDVRGAVKWLDGGKADLTAAARWFAENGPGLVERATLKAAVGRFLAEYKSGPKETYRTWAQELESFLDRPGNAELMLMDLDESILTRWTNRKVNGGKETAARRTVDNRMTTWITFLNRCRDWNLLPEKGKHVGELLKRPVVPDAGKEIFTVSQGGALIKAVRDHDADTTRQGKQLEIYLLIGGWLGLRPSEIQRLQWEEDGGLYKGGFDWERGYLHVSARVAQKNSSERFIPMDERLSKRLKTLFEASGKKKTAKCCGFRSREFLSVLAREKGICSTWPADVLRHSFCSYRIAVVKSLEQVATEADNSPAILKSNYRRPMRHEDGLAWWELI
jgi:integrase